MGVGDNYSLWGATPDQKASVAKIKCVVRLPLAGR